MSAKKEARPQSVSILGKPHSISYKPAEDMEDSFGLCFNGLQRIDIMDGLPSGEEVDVVLHEVLHAVIFQMGVRLSHKAEEKFVLAAATGLHAVLKDNPQFTKWLLQQAT